MTETETKENLAMEELFTAWKDVIDSQDGEFLSRYFNLGLTVAAARTHFTCAAALAAASLPIYQKKRLHYLNALTRNVQSFEEKKKWELFEQW